MDETLKVGWVVDNIPPFTRGRQFSIKNFRDAAPPNVEIIDINPERPQECDIYAVHSVQIPQNLPRFSKKRVGGKFKSKQVVMYAHQLVVNDLGANYVIFQSPLHAEWSVFGKKIILPPPLVESDFIVDEPFAGQKFDAMWVGNFDVEEGVDITVRWSEVNHINTNYFGSNMPKNAESTNTHFRGWVQHEQMPSIYAQHNKMVFLPRNPQPFGRAIAEAYLAGLELVVSGKIGAESFNNPLDEVFKSCLSSADAYWNILLEIAAK